MINITHNKVNWLVRRLLKQPSQELINKYSELEEYKIDDPKEARTARKVFAYMRKNQSKGYPFYICIKQHTYKRFTACTPQERASYFKEQMQHWYSHYYDTILPLKKKLSAEEKEVLHVDNLFVQLERIFENEEE